MPTQYPELDEVLADLVDGIRGILGGDLVGLYLVGSFALGDADLHSDCDFITAIRRPLTAGQEAGLRELHADIPTRAGFWTKHLEGSYAPIQDLQTLDALGTDWLYVDHGWRELQWSPHCNTVEQRWTLAERGIAVTGPDPTRFAARVPADHMRAAMAEQLPRLLDDLATWVDIDALAWGQRYAVVSLCRMAWSHLDGQVHSKAASLDWAMGHFDEEWTPLLRQVKADRSLDWDPNDRPRTGSVELTREFVAEVLSEVT